MAASYIWVRAAGFPTSVYIGEFVVSLLPMIFYFVGRVFIKESHKWYRNFLIAVLVCGFVGLILYCLAPDFYNQWSLSVDYISKADAQTTRVRMNSVVGSTCLSAISVLGMVVSSGFIKKDNKNKSVIAIASFFMCMLFAILSNQRSGLVVAFLVLVYVNYLLFFVLDIIPRKYFKYELIAIAVVFGLLCVVKIEYVLKFWYRIESLPGAVSERSEQWIAAVNNMYSTWLGNGLGCNGHRALGIENAHVIADGSLVKLYCEDGVIGFSIFVYLLILIIKKGIANIDKYYVEVGIIIALLLQSIGSNMLAFQLCTPIFWYAIGRINRIDK